jgi:uncharacterized membrane-anchored protein
MQVKGKVRLDRRTKRLVGRLKSGEIAVIQHQDLDEVAAESLIEANPRAIINARQSISGRYPNPGPATVLEAGIPILDNVGDEIFLELTEGQQIEIQGSEIYSEGELVGRGTVLTHEAVVQKMADARSCLSQELDKFVQNTLEYAKKEKDLIIGGVKIPDVDTELRDRQVLVVVRGQHYREDLFAIRSYINEMQPVLVTVDGGADGLLEFGYRPDMIVGDMDSVSDKALQSGAELVVHAYPDGRAPGLARIQKLGLEAKVFAASGTSEDIAMLLAYEKGASLIVAVGTHSNMIDFLEKGRQGMGSTFLVRLKVGSILIDAKGVNRLYRGGMRAKYFFQLTAAALLPFLLVVGLSEPLKQFGRLLWMKFRIMIGF